MATDTRSKLSNPQENIYHGVKRNRWNVAIIQIKIPPVVAYILITLDGNADESRER